jgi:hypothetical protein
VECQLIPNAKLPIEFSISEAGQIAAVVSANPTEIGSFEISKRILRMGNVLQLFDQMVTPASLYEKLPQMDWSRRRLSLQLVAA